jgi:hypothetical protein
MVTLRRLAVLTIALVLARLVLYAAVALWFGGLADAMCQYDCGWYVRLAAHGYLSDSTWDTLGPVPNWAFFPLFPLLLRATGFLTGLRGEWAGLLLANLLFVGFILASAIYLRRTRPALDPRIWVLFAVLFPFGFTFSVPYTESLFALLTILVLLALQDRRVVLASVLTALLCATRPTGVLMIPIILAEVALPLWRGRHAPDRMRLLGEALLPLAIAPLGLSLYMAYQYAVIGDALAFSHVQLLWGRQWTGPVNQLTHAFADWDWARVLAPNGVESRSYAAAWAVLGLVVACGLAWKRRWVEAYLLAASVLLPLSTAMHSLPRFVATNPFFLFACTGLLARIPGQSRRMALLGGLAPLQAAVLVGWFIAANTLY